MSKIKNEITFIYYVVEWNLGTICLENKISEPCLLNQNVLEEDTVTNI